MTTDEISNEHLKSLNSSWDFYPDPVHDIDKISIEKVKKFIKQIENRSGNEISLSPLKFLEKLEFTRQSKPTFGAYLLFVTDNVTENVTDNKTKDILNLIKENNNITTTELASLLNIARRTVARYIGLLKSEGKLKRIGPDKGGYWEVVGKG